VIYDRANISERTGLCSLTYCRDQRARWKSHGKNYLVDLLQSANIALHALCLFQYPTLALIHRMISSNEKLSIIKYVSPLILVSLYEKCNSFSNEHTVGFFYSK